MENILQFELTNSIVVWNMILDINILFKELNMLSRNKFRVKFYFLHTCIIKCKRKNIVQEYSIFVE